MPLTSGGPTTSAVAPIPPMPPSTASWRAPSRCGKRSNSTCSTGGSLAAGEAPIEAEHDENELRLAFTAEERVAIGKEYKRVMGERQGERTDLRQPRDNCPEVEPGQRTRDIIARKVGFSSGKQYERAEAVVEHGAPNVVEAMNKGELARAIRRAGELLKEFDARGDHRKKGGAPLSSPSRTEAGADAGMSERQQDRGRRPVRAGAGPAVLAVGLDARGIGQEGRKVADARGEVASIWQVLGF